MGGLPKGASFDPVTGELSWTPTAAEVGSKTLLQFRGRVGMLEASPAAVNLEVTHVPSLMVVKASHQNEPLTSLSVVEGELIELQVLAKGQAQGETVTYAAEPLPTGAVLKTMNGQFLWTPSRTQATLGRQKVQFKASFGGQLLTLDFSFTLRTINHSPTIDVYLDEAQTSPVTLLEVRAESEIKLYVVARDSDTSDSLKYSLKSPPAGATFASPVFSWTPSVDQIRLDPYSLTFAVTDGSVEVEKVVTLQVINPDLPVEDSTKSRFGIGISQGGVDIVDRATRSAALKVGDEFEIDVFCYERRPSLSGQGCAAMALDIFAKNGHLIDVISSPVMPKNFPSRSIKTSEGDFANESFVFTYPSGSYAKASAANTDWAKIIDRVGVGTIAELTGSSMLTSYQQERFLEVDYTLPIHVFSIRAKALAPTTAGSPVKLKMDYTRSTNPANLGAIVGSYMFGRLSIAASNYGDASFEEFSLVIWP